MGGGFVVGNSESQNTITGSEIGYVYPDTLTAIVGQFENEYLMDGRSLSMYYNSFDRLQNVANCFCISMAL